MTSTDLHDSPALIALDWGTSSLRAYALGAGGRVLASRRSEHGIMHLPAVTSNLVADRFEAALQSVCGAWLQEHPDVPLLACGMVGSAQGWKDAAYQPLPSRAADLSHAFTVVPRGSGPSLHIVPGLIQRGDLPNVMRGEETQIAGVLQSLAPNGDALQRMVIGLPGTHSKWALVEDGSITRFETFMTGEVFAAFCQHTLLGRTMAINAAFDEAAFTRGLRVARSPEGAMGVLSNVFSCRTLGLTGSLPSTSQPDYLSGLLIGHEVAALAGALLGDGLRVVLCGEPSLCQRYAAALEVHGQDSPLIRSEVTPLGLWSIAQAGGLI
ncbi:2-dehydro-3-deoxygalactonokinase [Hydrogenophaga palleronii]|uniref:2-dehydro-3-deoxygalactonokinase n=1 Tax=Hydrogenophaga palleronii TaxID=65655 RepID=A0ABU1WQS3_9BURK|nr:2-dehydro-3-deoxygalactonokinase [Hydrogenophaga palleronii]MDR7151641.1 2-dehydro-3-deoxygalactonokinase [Hydrogenophaga palleronii]